MTSLAAVPFTLRRSTDLWTSGGEYESTTQTAHGLVRLEPDRLVLQWRVAVETQLLDGSGYATREEIEPVQEMAIPLASVAGAVVPQRRWWQFTGPRLVLTATDLLAFEKIAGQQGLKLKHPAKLVLRIKRSDRLIASEFAAELALTLARLQVADGGRRLDGDRGITFQPGSSVNREEGPGEPRQVAQGEGTS